MPDLCRFWHDRVVCSSSSIRSKKWSEWCDQSMEAGARQAHGYMNDRIVPQRFQHKGPADIALDCCPLSSRMAAEHEKWAKAWGCDGPLAVRPTFGDQRRPAMELPSADLVKEVSKRFKTHTCQPDGWHPRHYSLLGEESRAAFGKLPLLMEMRGQTPTSTQKLVVQLNHKPLGDRRPLGFYPAPARIPGRLWRHRLRRWERYQGLGG
eukprot:1819310-Pyramimonas_sp.AAC.2